MMETAPGREDHASECARSRGDRKRVWGTEIKNGNGDPSSLHLKIHLVPIMCQTWSKPENKPMIKAELF